MIDPIEVVLVAARADAGIAAAAGTQVGVRHRFGTGVNDWSVATVGITMRMDGGPAEPQLAVQAFRVECRVYAPTYAAAWPAVGAVFEWARETRRSVVAVTGGNAVLYHVTPETAPAGMLDVDTENPFYIFFMTAAVAEGDVP